MELQSLINAWLLSPELHMFQHPATESEVASVEAELGCKLPAALRELYMFSNGVYLLSGNLSVYPLHPAGEHPGLTDASTKLRQWEWPVPKEVLVFGGNGSDELLGLWLPETKSGTFIHPIIEIGEVFTKSKSMAIVGTDVLPFLIGWTAYYLLLCEGKDVALNTISIPSDLRNPDPDFAQLRRWADPQLPDLYPDPYRRGKDVEELRELFGTRS